MVRSSINPWDDVSLQIRSVIDALRSEIQSQVFAPQSQTRSAGFVA